MYLRFFMVCVLLYHLEMAWPWYALAVALWLLDHWLPSNVPYRGLPHGTGAPHR
jgi:hypothetical protein